MNILTRIKDFVKSHLDDIILVVGVILISLLSFAAGYITASQQGKEPIKIESGNSIYEDSHSWSRDKWTLSSLEIK